MANPRWTESSVPRSLPERVAQLYYSHGLFCATHPFIVIFLALSITLLCCYPLLSLPLPGNVPQQYAGERNISSSESPRWLQASSPVCYIQQIVMKSAVSPWSDSLLLTDAYRAPLAEVFSLLEVIQNYQDENSSLTLADLCFHVESAKSKRQRDLLPEYSCLVLSPANLWQQDAHLYNSDINLISTIYSYQNLQKGKVSLTEVLFGLNLKDTGIKRYPLRKRQRIIQFAVTVVFRNYDKQFLDGLRDRLSRLYPLHQSSGPSPLKNNNNSETDISQLDTTLHIYYPGEFDYKELVPLTLTYFILFFYVYFSVRKIELVRSKVGIALSAVITVLSSLAMTVGLCFFFGLELAGSGRGREVFPYLVVVVGLENVVVLTKSVVSTAPHLDVKIRIAQGLSREGWSITKNLLTEVTILTVGLLTLVPDIQEFCIFAIVGLLSDFFLQMFFFMTILGLDIRQTDVANESTHSFLHRYNQIRNTGLSRSRSHPRLSNSGGPPKIPKRLKLVHFWARTRIVQRAFMVCMVIWIGGIVYSAGMMERFISISDDDGIPLTVSKQESLINKYKSSVSGELGRRAAILDMEEKMLASHKHTIKQVQDDTDLSRLKPNDYEPWRRVSPHHWAAILSLHNNTPVAGGYVTLLPAIQLASPISPDRAVALRNPLEKQMPQFQWHSLALALDPLDLTDGDLGIGQVLPSAKSPNDSPFVPSSPMELFLAALLCGTSTMVVAYTVLVLYRCICSRNYAEWRASWGPEKDSSESGTQVILEAMPLVLDSHTQEVECMATDGNSVVSTCLAGELRCWDASTGELTATINREMYFHCRHHLRSVSSDIDDSTEQDVKTVVNQRSPKTDYDEDILYKELSAVCLDANTPNKTVRSRYKSSDQPKMWDMPDLSPTININFSSRQSENHDVNNIPNGEAGFDYGPRIRNLYEEFEQEKLKNSETGEVECKFGGSAKCERRSRTSISDCDNEACAIERGDHLSNGNGSSSSGGGGGVTLSGVSHDQADVSTDVDVSPIWCIDCQDNLIVVGCANGRMEFWCASTGSLKYITDEIGGAGLTCVRLVATTGHHVVAARLNGALDIYSLTWQGNQTLYRRTHIRTGSAGSLLDWSTGSDAGGDLKLNVVRTSSTRAHQQPITVLDVEGGRVLSGSQDHTLKVIGLLDQVVVYTLHGHCGPITALFIDRISPTTAGSGSQDGMLCVWDLLTGACMYSLQAHDGSIMTLTYSASYVISLGADERLCVWERFQGHLLNTIQVSQTYCTSMVMLTHNLLITSKQGSLVVWDVRSGEPVRLVKLGLNDSCVFVQHLVPLRNSIACDYGCQLRIVHFPLVRDKSD